MKQRGRGLMTVVAEDLHGPSSILEWHGCLCHNLVHVAPLFLPADSDSAGCALDWRVAAAVPRDRPWMRCTGDTAGSPIAAKLAGSRCACANSQRARASDTRPERSAGCGAHRVPTLQDARCLERVHQEILADRTVDGQRVVDTPVVVLHLQQRGSQLRLN